MPYAKFKTMPFVLGVEDIADTFVIRRNKAYRLVSLGIIKVLKIGQHL